LTSRQAIAKEVTTLVLLFTSFIVALLPRLISWKVNPLVFSALNCMAGGVVLGTAFSHMLPSAIESFEVYFADKSGRVAEYPWAFLFSVITLMGLIALDKMFAGTHTHDIEEVEIIRERRHTVFVLPPGASSPQNQQEIMQKYCQEHSAPPRRSTMRPRQPTGVVDRATVTRKSEYNPSSVSLETKGLLDDDDHQLSCDTTEYEPCEHKYEVERYQYDDPSGKEHVEHIIETSEDHFMHERKAEHKTKVAQAYIFLIAISLHSLFEGMGLGAEHELDAVFGMLLAVFSHKWLEAFALGCSLHYAGISMRSLVGVLIIYSVATPLGIVIGMALGNLPGEGYSLTAGILVSMASGSFLYISLIELIPNEFNKHGWLKTKLIVTWLGWAIMAIMAAWV